MKKLISLLLAGVAIVALSGCSDKVGEPESVDINNLYKGYLVTGEEGIAPVAAGTLNIEPEGAPPLGDQVATIQFCPDNIAIILWRDGNDTNEEYTIEGTDISFLPSGAAIYTDVDGTSGKLKVGITYEIVTKDSKWTIADIQLTTEGCP